MLTQCRPWPCAVLSALLLSAAAPTAARAQTLSGYLVDEQTLEGIDGASVLLLSSAREPLRGTVTDSLGHFVLPAPGFGAYFIRAQHLRYGSVTTDAFNLYQADTVTVTFYVTEQAITLDPIVVGVRAVTGSELFAERLETGQGLFFTPEMVDSLRPTTHLAEIFEHAQDDIFLTWSWGQREEGGYGPIPSVRSYRGAGCLNYIVDRTPVPEPWYEDVRSSWGVAPLSEVGPDDVVAIEVYRGWWEVPKDYEDQILANTLGTRRKLREMRRGECGVVVIWTEDGWGESRGRF